jgi:hypothetical protein
MSNPDIKTALPELPAKLINSLGEYGMSRSDGCSDLITMHRWETVIGNIKAYAEAAVLSALAEKDADAVSEREAGIYDRGFAFGVLAGWNGATQPEEFHIDGDKYRNPPANDAIVRRAQKTIEETRKYAALQSAGDGDKIA